MSWHTPTPQFGSTFCLKLINLVRQNPPLFAVTCTNEMTVGPRKNRNEMNNIWEEIAAELELSAIDCKRRWKGLKDVYAKIRKKRIQEAVLGMKPKKKWIYEDIMSFVKFPFEHKYQQALESFEDVDLNEWKMDDVEDNDTGEVTLEDPEENITKTESQLDDQIEDGTVEYLDLDLEVDAIPDAEEFYSNKGTAHKERHNNEILETKPQMQASILKPNNNNNNNNTTKVKVRSKYRPIRPKPYQPTILTKNGTSGISSIVNVSGLSSNSFVVTSPSIHKGKNYKTVIVTSPDMKLKDYTKSINGNTIEPTLLGIKNGDRNVAENSSITLPKKDSRVNKFQEKDKGSIDLFFESMAQTVLSLPMHVQAEIKMQICKLVTMAEIKYSSQSKQKYRKS